MKTRRGPYVALMSLGALGVVFGDIGTSPLYAFRETFHAGDLRVVDDTVLGVASTMVWSLIIVVTIKYLLVVMRADNDGEGGILALTALAAPTSRFGTATRGSALVMLGLFGTALLYGDGIITPAISVLSAVEGVEVVAPSLEPLVVPVAVVILVALFGIQRRGTGALGRVFGPAMVVWFVALGGARCRQCATRTGGSAGVRSQPSRATLHRTTTRRVLRPRSGVLGGHGCRGVVRRHGPLRQGPHPTGLVRPGVSRFGDQLPRPGGAPDG